MSVSAGFFWGKLSGICAGILVGVLVSPAFWWLYHNPELTSQLSLLEQIAMMWVLGGAAGAALGAILGTTIGVLLTLLDLTQSATQIGTFLGGVIGLLLALLLIQEDVEQLAIMPIIGLLSLGTIGWVNGRTLEWRS